MKSVVAAAIVLVLLVFLAPLLLWGGNSAALLAETPPPTATLPIDRAPRPTPAVARKMDKETLVQVKMPDGTVAQLTMAEYLFRVVAAEVPASFEPEAIKAQAVTARTYTLWKGRGAVAAHPDANVCTDITCCQAYLEQAAAAANWGEAAPKYTGKIAEAIAATDAVTIRYDGAPIDAVFFSSAPGRTADAAEVWGSPVPYLASVPSPEGVEVPNYRTTVTVPLADFKTAFLAKHPQAKFAANPADWFQNRTETANGSVETLDVGGVTVKGTALRSLFSLRSASFTVAADATAVTFSVTGYGHGVGMSQYGANALAQQGKTYDEILKWYYTGVEIGT